MANLREIAPIAETYYLKLSAKGASKKTVRVQYADDASRLFSNYRDTYGFGASDMALGCGDVVDVAGKFVGRISYNGRIWDVDGNPFDGLSGRERLARSC